MKKLVCVVAVAAATVVAVAPAGAAPGGGAVVLDVPCTVALPGFGTASGTGRIVFTPTGVLITTCNAQLPSTVPAPVRAVQFPGQPCASVVTPSGHVVSHCRQ